MLPDAHPLKSVFAALSGCVRALDAMQAPYMLIGGVAAGLMSEVRATDDVDVSIWLEDDEKVPQLIHLLEAQGYKQLHTVPMDLILRARLLRMIHLKSATRLDVALAVTPFEEQAIRNSRRTAFGVLSIPLPRPEDVVVMKIFAGRLIDLADVHKLLLHNPQMDLRHARKWTKELARLAESPDLLKHLEEAGSGARKRSKLFRGRMASTKRPTRKGSKRR